MRKMPISWIKMTLYLAILSITFSLVPVMASPTIVIVSNTSTEWSSDGTPGSWSTSYAETLPSNYVWPSISGATWIWRAKDPNPASEYTSVPPGGWHFRKVFSIPSYISGSIQITADNAYELYVNGHYIGGDGNMNKDGPDHLEWYTIETYDIGWALQTGENTILIRAINYFKDPPYDTYASNACGVIFKVIISNEHDVPELPYGEVVATVASLIAISVPRLKRRKNNST